METKFQTSFIPKKPLIPMSGLTPAAPRRSVSLFMVIAVLLFIASIAAAGGTFFWKSYVDSSQVKYKEELALREKQFNPNLIEDLKRQNVKIDLGKQLLDNHVAVSQIFDIIGRLTIENVRFTSMDLTVSPQTGEGIKISMKGYGTSLSAIAWQSDVLGKLERYGLRKVVKNPILSDPSLDTNGQVSFGFSASIDPGSLSYTTSLKNEDDAANASTTTQ